MKRYVLNFVVTAIGLGGFLLAFIGLLLATGTRVEAVARGWWRAVGVGMVMMGLSMLPNLGRLPDYVPAWVKRRLAPALAFSWVLLGAIVFVLSWLMR